MELLNVVVVDTSALMQSLNVVKDVATNSKLVITAIVLEELDKHKDSNDHNKSFKARQALKFINDNQENIQFSFKEKVDDFLINKGLDANKNDNKILTVAYELKAAVLTYDIGMKVKAKDLGLPVINTLKHDKEYTGYTKVSGTTDEINRFFELIESGDNEFSLYTNQYIIINNTDTKDEKVMRYDGTNFVSMKVPHYAKHLKPKNSLQLAALDLMFNKDIPIKVICGTFGSGKTYLAVKGAKAILDHGDVNKMLLVRNPIPADGVDIGALPGDKEDKVGSYFKPLLQYIEDDFCLFDPEAQKKQQMVECEIVTFMKGISVDNTIMVVDEAEDLNLKLLKMVGTRIGEGSSVVFTGDYKQAESKYKSDNGLNIFINKCKGNPLVGIIVLEEDVRSKASKVFADL